MAFIKLGDINPDFDGWVLDRGGLHSPEQQTYQPSQLYYYHWQGQLLSVLRYRLNHPEQFDLFDDPGGRRW